MKGNGGVGQAEVTGEAFDAVIREQAAAFEVALDPVEQVAARVSRARGFSNVGMAGSGHRLTLDEPEVFGGGGTGADPAEAMLVAIGASLSVTLTVHAALAGIALGAVEVALSGKLDPARFFRPSAKQGGGIYDLRLDVTLGSDAGEPALADLLDRALQACPVLRSIDARSTTRLSIKEPS